jgi:hypothetical protein
MEYIKTLVLISFDGSVLFESQPRSPFEEDIEKVAAAVHNLELGPG